MSRRAVWTPTPAQMEQTRLYRWMQQLGYSNYDQFYRYSIENVSDFWDAAVRELDIHWFRPYAAPADLSQDLLHPAWFVGGQLNSAHNAVDKWFDVPEVWDKAAILWEAETGETGSYSYAELAEQVNRAANGLRGLGIGIGDRVAVYLPMIPQAVISMLALAKLGAVSLPIFSGFGAEAVAKRLIEAETKLLITADGYMRRGKAVAMKSEAERAAALAGVGTIVVVRNAKNEIAWNAGRDVDWEQLLCAHGQIETAKLAGDSLLMLLFTSGTTGAPKGIMHSHAGFPIKAAFDAAYAIDFQRKDALMWLTDMGWMMGPFAMYGVLLNGGTLVLYDGVPDFPDPGRLWRMVERHRITHLGVSPTLIRVLMKQGNDWFSSDNMGQLRVFASTGEPWNLEPWLWLYHKVGGGKIPIVNFSGGTETSGGILTNVLVKPIAPMAFNTPIPGMAADIYNQAGQSVQDRAGEVGELVMKRPWVGMTGGFWMQEERFVQTYGSRWPDTWAHGDWVKTDDEGYWYITGRSDDTLNIAGKRIGPAEIESVLTALPEIVEAAVIGIPDEVKGEAAVCFVVMKSGLESDKTQRVDNKSVWMQHIASQLGKALCPKEIHIIGQLPKTRNGKVMRRVLRSAYLDLDTGDISALEHPQVIEQIRQIHLGA